MTTGPALTAADPWSNPFPADDPRSMLLEYQFKYWTDKSRFKIGLWSRQTGKDHTTSGEAAEDCYKAIVDGRNGTQWMIAAPSERQSLESLDKAKEWVEAFGCMVDDYEERREGASSESLLKSAEITIRAKNGPKGKSKLRAVPGKPSTVRGLSANLVITEFDFLEQPDETWRAVLPSITNPLKGGKKVVRLITTPNGIGSAAHKIWQKKDGKVAWSRHKVTIYDAVRMGLPVDIEELREAFDDPEGWAQEFECEFLDTASVLLPYEVLALIENPSATLAAPEGYWEASGTGAPSVVGGIDFGRKKDLTVFWGLEDIGGFAMTREVMELEKMPTHEQMAILRPRLRRCRRICHDYTGPGIGLGDLMVAEFGEWKPEEHKFGKIELCTFTNQLKCEIFPAVRAEADRRMVGIPQSRTVREDLHSMCRVITAAGNVTYKAPHTADGHADRCTALALALRAKSSGTQGAITEATFSQILTGGNAGLALPRFTPRTLFR